MFERLRYLTSGESHGKALLCILEGIPSNLPISASDINKDLLRRQRGYGRGGRMKIESDTAQILSGVRLGKTTGSPITVLIENRDWQKEMGGFVTCPRPGHADLAGAMKYNTHDIRDILERSSARETAVRVAAGAIAKKFLREFNIRIISYVVEIGGVAAGFSLGSQESGVGSQESIVEEMFERAEASPVRCPDKEAEKRMIDRIDEAGKKGDSLGGIFEVVALSVPVGLGSFTQWDRRLNARLSYAITGIQAIKGVEIGLGFEMSRRFGSEVMDEIFYTPSLSLPSGGGVGFYRRTNYAGGIEGGISNGMPIVLKAAMKPIPTLKTPLRSVDIVSKKSFKAHYERSDVCAVPSASVIGEAATALVIADAFLEKFGGDSMEEVKRNYEGYLKQIREF